MTNLKPCPFCGSEAMCHQGGVMCLNSSCFMFNQALSVDAWNNRPIQARLESELEEYANLIKLQHRRSVEASKLWQEAHNKPLVWPDLGELLAWLMGQTKEGKK